VVPVTAAVSWAMLLGVVLGLGAWSLVSLLPRVGALPLASRVAPYLLDVSEHARRLVARKPIDPVPVVGALLAPAFVRARLGLESVLGGADRLRIRLRQAGSPLSVEQFRAQQLTWALVGAAFAAGGDVLVALDRAVPLTVTIALPVVGALLGVTLRDVLLQRAVRVRLARIAGEFPTVVEFLTLSVSAGEGVLDALRRVARVTSGELSREIGLAVSDARTGVGLASALEAMDARLGLPAVSRLVEQIVAALEKGTPLAEVLRAQASDAREVAKRDLLEAAGKKEVAMLVPLVFLILPVTVVFAIYPGIFVLQTGF
jgi:tight adherence protein C